MASDLNIGVTGAAGRMGRMIITAIAETPNCRLAAALEADGAEATGRDAATVAGMPACGVAIGNNPLELFSQSDVVIDFTAPAATRAYAALAAETGTAFVTGTTGLTLDDNAVLDAAAQKTPLLWAPNMSLGVNLLLRLVTAAAQALPGTDIEIVEMHHRHKVDAPSGTALALGRAADAGRNVNLEDVQRLSREGMTGARPDGEIGFATLRGGDVAGEHTVVFAADGERIELTHRATNRLIFARGAVEAARWLADKPAGRYEITDVLNLTG